MCLADYKNMTLHIFQSINVIKQLKERPRPLAEQIVDFEFKKPGFDKLIIFDLDETLIHSLIEREDLDQSEEAICLYNFKPEVWVDLEEESGIRRKHGFSVRPFALDCLRQANLRYEVAIFTASVDWYADPIIDYLDPTGELIQHRFYQQHTTFLEEQGFCVKDLRIFKGLDLAKVLLVDNYVSSFAFHLANGVPVVPFFGNKDDRELIKVIKYLNKISPCPDLRIPNEKAF